MSSEGSYIGIDVSKKRLDVAVRPGDEQWSVANEEEGIGARWWAGFGRRDRRWWSSRPLEG